MSHKYTKKLNPQMLALTGKYQDIELQLMLSFVFSKFTSHSKLEWTNDEVLYSITPHSNSTFNSLIKKIKPEPKNSAAALAFSSTSDEHTSLSKQVLLHVAPLKQHSIRFTYTEKITAKFLEALLESFFYILKNYESIRQQTIRSISITSERQMKSWLAWNKQEINTISSNETIISLFEKSVKHYPNRTALIDSSNNTSISYVALKQHADAVAQQLTEKGVRPRQLIAVSSEKTIENIASILGILKAGCAYLPLELRQPHTRIKNILTNAKANYLATRLAIDKAIISQDKQILISFNKTGKQKLQRNKNKAAPNNTAYVIYTSGSTGSPKGVNITHRAVINTLTDMVSRLRLTKADTLLNLSSLGFDLSVFDLFAAFINANSTVLIDTKINKDPKNWIDIIEKYKVSVFNAVPALGEAIVNTLESTKNKVNTSLKKFIFSGDLIPPKLPESIKKTCPNTKLIFGLGGSTEASIWSIGSDITEHPSNKIVPYGKPLPGQSIWILDEYHHLLPKEAMGEIAIGGAGLAKNYWRDKQLTSERYIQHPKLGRLFLTRDAGKLSSLDQMISFHGRLDRQIKLRGYRIDTLEIENAINQIPGILRTAVLATKNNNQLTAFIQQNSKTNAEEIRSILKQHLPLELIPNKIIPKETLPLTSNGKIDINGLAHELNQKQGNSKSLNYINHQASNNPACIYQDKLISYDTLKKDILAFKKHLSSLKDCQRIMLALGNSYEYILAILSCLNANISFIPADIAWSNELIEKRLIETDCDYLISTNPSHLQNKLCKFSHERNKLYYYKISKKKAAHNDSNIAYIMYTSGSTGRAKGIKISHQALSNNLKALSKAIGFSQKDCWLWLTRTTFDISLLEILCPLMNAGSLLIPCEQDQHNIKALQNLAKKYNASYIQLTPSYLEKIKHQIGFLKQFKTLLIGGETLNVSLLKHVLTLKINIIHLYGPTEATIWTSVNKPTVLSELSLGTPISGTDIFLLDKNNNLISQKNKNGELCISGNGLATGYLNKSQTQKSFITIKNNAGKKIRVYKTGDEAYYDNDLQLQFKGRLDRQIKVKGVRIDPVEIEQLLKRNKDISQAIVMKSPLDENQLLACIEPSEHKTPPMALGVFCFPEESAGKKYHFDFYMKLAIKCDKLGLDSFWIPERHFDVVGAPFSSTAVFASALASLTKNIKISAGSIVLPLHNPVNIAESWATIDNISQGRIQVAVASGWHPNDFSLAPENFKSRKEVMLTQIDQLKSIWETGYSIEKNGHGEQLKLDIYPRPFSKTLPLWMSIASDEKMFVRAGEKGLNIFTHLLMQSTEELKNKINTYRQALSNNGHDPKKFKVTLMLHTFINSEESSAKKIAAKYLQNYFKAHLNLIRKLQKNESDDLLTKKYFENTANEFIKNKSLIGNYNNCKSILSMFHSIGVDEIACLLDFGPNESEIDNTVTELEKLKKAQKKSTRKNIVSPIALENALKPLIELEKIPDTYLFLNNIPNNAHKKQDIQKTKALAKELLNKQRVEPHIDPEEIATNVAEKYWNKVLNVRNSDPKKSFFELGGHSLKAIEFLNYINDELEGNISIGQFLGNPYLGSLIALSAKKPSTKEQATNTINPLKATYHKKLNLVSPMQKAIWIFCNLHPYTTCYHDGFLFQISNTIEYEALINAVEKTMNEAPILKAYFKENNGRLLQGVSKSKIPIEKIMHINHKSLENAINESFKLGFDLKNGPLARAVIHILDNEIQLQLIIHHIVTDGKTIKNLVHRIANIISNKTEPETSEDYYSFIENEKINSRFQKADIKKYIDLLDLKTSREHELNNKLKKRSFSGFSQSIKFSKNEIKCLNRLSALQETSINNIILLAYAETILSFFNEERTQIGIPIALRENKWQKSMGLFVNFGVLPLKKEDIHGSQIDYQLNIIKQKMSFILEHRHLQFSDLAAFFGKSLMTESQPLFRYAFNPFDMTLDKNSGIKFKLHDFNISRFDIELQLIEIENDLIVNFIYSSDAFDKKIADSFSMHFQNIFRKKLGISLGKDTYKATDYWKRIYDQLYQKAYNGTEDQWVGWISAKTQKPFKKAEMDGWLNNIKTKILDQPAGRVLEIGCGTGSIQRAIYPNYDEYVGIDISEVVIQKNKLSCKHDLTTFLAMKAVDIDQLEPEIFDTIIINSVSQYLDGFSHLKEIITKAYERLSPITGRIIIGDIRNPDWYGHYINHTASDVKETEKLFSPSDIFKITQSLPGQVKLFIEPNFCSMNNELSLFRFDAIILQQSENHKKNDVRYIANHFNDEKALVKYMLERQTDALCITHIKNSSLSNSKKSMSPAKIHSLSRKIGLNLNILISPDSPDELYCSTYNADLNLNLIYNIAKKNIHDEITSLRKEDDHSKYQEKLKAAWKKVLPIKNFDLQDDFFNLGGNSLSFIHLYNEISKFHSELNIEDLLPCHTFYSQLQLISQGQANDKK